MKVKQIRLAVLFFILGQALYAQSYDFPLKVSENKRYLADQQGKPFLYVSDAAWSLFIGFSEAEVKEYLGIRKQQGFSVIQVMMTYVPAPDAFNPEGQLPFEAYDFARPNERYFDHIEKIVAIADSMNMVMAMVPLWYSCCNDGWGSNPEQYMKKNGLAKCAGFGTYIGQRFGKYPNVMWILGGDNDPFENLEEVRALALALKAAAPQQLQTYHAASTHASTDVWPNESWLDFSMVYTYFRGFPDAWNGVQPDVYEVSYTEYRKSPVMPFVLGESNYEAEHTDRSDTELQARKQAWYTLLSGGCGHAYGSPFWVAGYRRQPGNPAWREIMKLPGANSLIHLNSLFQTFNWTELVPDLEGRFFLSGNHGFARNDFAVASISGDSSVAVLYFPSPRTVQLDTRTLRSRQLTAVWYNPRTGASEGQQRFSASSSPAFTPPDEKDWVLVIRARN